MTPEALLALADRARAEIEAARDPGELEGVRRRVLGRRDGLLTIAGAGVAERPAHERAALGRAFNQAKSAVEGALEARGAALAAATAAARAAGEWVDCSALDEECEPGRIHPVTRVLREIAHIFGGLGYAIAEGPEVEVERFNFELLNIPAGHPARDSQDTLYLSDTILLRTHTSPVQMRTMLSQPPPIRIIAPGRTYRRDNPDPTHLPMFHQVEGLVVDEGITVGDLKGTLLTFARSMFGATREIRLRPNFFPYTEPSMEVDVSCFVCDGSGCRTCHQRGWIEILGSGMVHPTVLRNGGIDPARHQGFAFGMGPERIAMLKYGIEDGRELTVNDIRFLHQF
ncbi:MAG TPA: phenylalanine--tRNA ligase subunit alpha [Verrucomicrobiae bacterium]|nr:phenylalanine--tRNA ligase subunit alpha [Verrucomicrobiae bacterium]